MLLEGMTLVVGRQLVTFLVVIDFEGICGLKFTRSGLFLGNYMGILG